MAVLGVALFGANAFFYVAIQQVPLAIAVAIEFMGPLVLATVLSRRKTGFGVGGTFVHGHGSADRRLAG